MSTWPLALAFGAALGAVCGLGCFGGLAVTVARLPTARHPGLLMAGSLAVRLGLTAAVLAVLVRWLDVAALVGAAIGIVAARTWLLRRCARGGTPTKAGEPRWT